MKKMKRHNVIAIIPARGGSKGLKGKNTVLLCGAPLIEWTINAAKLATSIDEVFVSSDDPDILDVATRAGATIPFIRPDEISADDTTTEAVLVHFYNFLKSKELLPDIFVYLQPTEPFRPPSMIDACVNELVRSSDLESVFMVHTTHKNFWRKRGDRFDRLANDIPYGIPRQHKEPLYREDTGLCLATRTKVIAAGLRIGDSVQVIPYIHPCACLDIHTEDDIKLAECLSKVHGLKPTDEYRWSQVD
jgi:CMP-N,N'-diacetyllegionaminic acid synthase